MAHAKARETHETARSNRSGPAAERRSAGVDQLALQRAMVDSGAGSLTPGAVRSFQGTLGNRVTNGLITPSRSGRALPEGLRASMERSFGRSFGDVRIHEDGRAEAYSALAVTSGRDIHFARGQFMPDTQRGRELIGHELTHVVQQAGSAAAVQGKGAENIGARLLDEDLLEQEANRIGERVARGDSVVGGIQTRARYSWHGRSAALQAQKSKQGSTGEASIDGIDWGYIEERENESQGRPHRIGYVPANIDKRSGKLRRIGKSGVTVATGVDLGQRDPSELGLSDELAKKLQPYHELSAAQINAYANKYPQKSGERQLKRWARKHPRAKPRPIEVEAPEKLTLTDAEVGELDDRMRLTAKAELRKAFNKNKKGPKFAALPPDVQTALMSTYYNLPKLGKKLFSSIHGGDYARARDLLYKSASRNKGGLRSRRRTDGELLNKALPAGEQLTFEQWSALNGKKNEKETKSRRTSVTERPVQTIQRSRELVDEAPAESKDQAAWILDAHREGFVTFNTPGAKRQVARISNEKKVMGLARGDEIPILAVEVGLTKKVIQRWLDAGAEGNKPTIEFGSFVRDNGKHGAGRAIDINKLQQSTSVDRTIQILNDLQIAIHSSYGVGLPFQGDFFDPADKIGAKKRAAEQSEEARAGGTLEITDAIKKFSSHVWVSTGRRTRSGRWRWSDKSHVANGAYLLLKSQALKDTFDKLRKAGFKFTIFPDNDNHMHLDVR